MKVCFLSDSFLKDPSTGINGAQVQMYLIAKGLAEKKLDIHYVAGTWNNKGNNTIEEIDGITVHWYKLRKYLPILNTLKILRLLQEINPEIIYNRGRSYLTGLGAFFTRMRGKKFVWASSADEGCQRWKHIKKLKFKRKQKWKKIILFPEAIINDIVCHYGVKKANFIITQTAKQNRDLKKFYNKRGVIIKSGHPIPQGVIKKEIPPVVLWIGNLTQWKQPEVFIRLAKECSNLGAKFVMVGDTKNSAYKSKLQKLSNGLNNFQFTGYLPNEKVNELLRRSSILVNTSIEEGISNVIVQACLRAVPVCITSNDPDNVIKENRIGFHSQSFEQLVKDVRYLIQHPKEREEMGNRAKEFAEREYNIDKIVEEYIEIFSKVLWQRK